MLTVPIIPQKIGKSGTPQFAAVSVGYMEIIKNGNNPDDDGNCRFIIDGDDLKIQYHDTTWKDTGWAITIA